MADVGISKGERDELRKVVRQQFRVLRHEVRQRASEMVADVEQRLANRYAKADLERMKVEQRVAKIVHDANAKLETIVEAEGEKMNLDDDGRYVGGYLHTVELSVPRIAWDDGERSQFRRALLAEGNALVADAMAQLERQEADLLKSLAMGALGSQAAIDFLGEIPTVAALVPTSRLSELESSFMYDPDAGRRRQLGR